MASRKLLSSNASLRLTEFLLAGAGSAARSAAAPDVAQVEAARGCVEHAVEVAGDKVRCYRIFAPAE